MYEAKTRLSELVTKAQRGIEVILMNRGKPVAKITPFGVKSRPRILGFARDIKILPGFDDIPEGFE
ncbi:MAG: type II toxin-antitoxin system prevent-host-death family antitoxin [Deltaproteobacteria bacterium]|nr:type II toxin-antitoxin system prevent-host-death family antitoxin [Deltaproteobacteria bacterium]MBI3294516.1 type II toxin-antitoxin system prevent-host-death family antitoxin [Deltaproteobacteria bacterium]